MSFHNPYEHNRNYSNQLFSSAKLPSDTLTYTNKKHEHFQKFQSKTQKNIDFEQSNNNMKFKNDLLTIRKFPQNLTNVRQTFSYIASTQRYESKKQPIIQVTTSIHQKQQNSQYNQNLTSNYKLNINNNENSSSLRHTMDITYSRKKAQSYFNLNHQNDIINQIQHQYQPYIKSQHDYPINFNNSFTNFTQTSASTSTDIMKNKYIRFSHKIEEDNNENNKKIQQNHLNKIDNDKSYNHYKSTYDIKNYSAVNTTSSKAINQDTTTIDDPIKRLKQQRQQKKITKIINQNNNTTIDQQKNIKSSVQISTTQQRDSYLSYPQKQKQRQKQGFFKKNYIQYYTPKVQKKVSSITTHRLSDQQKISTTAQRLRKDTSFENMIKSPTKTHTDIKNIRTMKLDLNSNSNILYNKNKKIYNQKVKLDDFIIGKHLGQGRFGAAYLAFHKKTGAIFAIKKIKKQTLKSNKLIDQFILQIKLQTYLIHSFILKIYGLFDDDQYIYIILQFMQQGTLFNYLKKKKKIQQDDTAQKIKYLAQAVKYLQDRGIAHRDIKPENIIMTNSVCKLADFGWATFCDEQRRKTYCGTCDYVAPEILEGHEYDETVDLWCIGVLAYELLTGRAPFYHMSRKQTMKKIINVAIQYPSHISQQTKSFINGLIQKDPESRMSIQQTLNHPFIKNVLLSP